MPDQPPAGYSTVCPYLVAEDAKALAEFMKTVFGAEEKLVMAGPGGMIMHGEMRIGNSVVMFANSCEQATATNTMLHVYVDDVDACYKRALDAGASSEREPTDQFYGDRTAGVKDAHGNSWYIATQVEEVAPEELKRRHDELLAKRGS
jgi:PhnB protein